MKVNDSGMPEQTYWNSLFDIPTIIQWLPLSAETHTIVEMGCGYGTFTVPVAQSLQGQLCAFDIEPKMLATAKRNVAEHKLHNVTFIHKDIIAEQTGLAPDSVDLVLLFNLLHSENNHLLLMETARILKNRGIVAIIHWRKDIRTPRGPVLTSRPDQVQILKAMEGLRLRLYAPPRILEPYHWGIQLIKEPLVN